MGTNGNLNGKRPTVKQQTWIPDEAGKCTVSHQKNRNATLIWGVMVALAVASFYYDVNTRLQYAGLSVLFPGGAFVGLGRYWIIGFPLTFALFCVSLFLWFATGNIVAPFLTWFGVALWIPFLPQATRPIAPYSPVIVGLLAAASYVYITLYMRRIQATKLARRKVRTEYLPRVIDDINKVGATQHGKDEDLELSLDDLKLLRWVMDLSFQDMDDWTGFDDIEQFQPAALRYQINESNYTLAFANRFYTPSFRGSYLQEAQERLLRRYCKEKVLWYWKYESIWGNLTTDYQPVLKDNIMLTGYYLLALELYRAATLDDKFTKDESVVLEVDKNHHYPHSSRTLAKALMDNWARSLYCLYPCEPNWIYTACNLYGINGLAAYDTNEGASLVSEVIPRFRKGFTEELMDADGSPVPIKSVLTGFVIPGLIGVTNDLFCAAMARSVMPDVAKMSYAIAKEEYLTLGQDGKFSALSKLQGADKLDPGNYKPSNVAFYAVALNASRSFGDDAVADAVYDLAEKDESLKKRESGGVTKWEAVSVTMGNQLLRARLMFHNGWTRLVSERMPQHLRDGPILADAKYPEVLVAKARSHDGHDLELVLYPGTEKTEVELGIKQLKQGVMYNVTGGGVRSFEADKNGEAVIRVKLNNRTQIWLKPCENM